MIKLTQFRLKVNKNMYVLGEFEGNEETGKVIVFSHGFGVKRDQRGKFVELGDKIKNKFLIVRFDYNKILDGGKSIEVYPYSTQKKFLDKILSFVRKKFAASEVTIIAYSMGCVVTALLTSHIRIKKVIMNVGPLIPPYKRFKEYFSQRKGTLFNEKGISKIERSDGSYTYVKSDFWGEIRDTFPLPLYDKMASKLEVCFIRALNDQVITEDPSSIKKIKSIKYFELPGDHDFVGKYRNAWIDLNMRLLK